jgi:nicotinamide mononucleotide adenylyltransferase
MKSLKFWSLIILFVLCDCLESQIRETELIAFQLEDQFGNNYTELDFLDEVVIIVGSDKEGSQYNEQWSAALYDSLKSINCENEVSFLPVADLRGVPFFLKKMVRNKFPKEKNRWILLDWKGLFAESYKFQSESSNILLLDKSNYMIYQTAVQEMDRDELEKLWSKVKGLLKTHIVQDNM